MFGFHYLRNVTTLVLDQSRCRGCGLCAAVCPHGVFLVENGAARIVDHDACMECGACARNCERAAIHVRAGVGCLEAIVRGALTGSEPACGCAGQSSCCN